MIARSDAVAALRSERFDVVVVGGGITGAGVALDAATRGYSVALVEKADFASGTSSRSSKLVHGGLRYLQNFDLGLVREALLERQLMVKLAPHLVRPLPFVVPAFDGARPDRMVGVGLNLYDAMAAAGAAREDGDWEPERHRVIGGDEVVERLPALAGRAPTSGYLFYDCQTDDSRLVLTVLAEAERFGAVCANRLEVTDLLDDGGRTRGVCVRDALSGERFELRADNVVNATGVWADRLRPEELHDEAEVPRIRPSRGTHITLAHETLPLAAGAIVPAGGGRSIFALPWLGSTLVGTTDNDYDASDLDHVQPGRGRRRVPAGRGQRLLRRRARPSGDITGAYAGVRPLISTGDPKKSVDISRKAELYETSSGMITITGGKLTTWRRMAKMAVDRLVEREARDAPCRTHEIPLGQAVDAADLPRVEGVPEAAYERLAGRYGHAAHEVLAVAGESGELAQPIVPGGPADLLAEAVYAARREQAAQRGRRAAAPHPHRRCSPPAASPTPQGATARRVAAAMARRAGVGRRAGAGRGAGLPRRGRRRGHRHPTSVTFSTLAGWIPATGPVDPKEPRPSMARRIALLAALAPLVLPAVAGAATPARFFAGTPIDGPSADIQALGDLDVARDGTRRAGLRQARRRGSTTSSSRGWSTAAFQPPEQVDAGLAGAGAQPVVAASDGGRLVVAFVSGGGVFATVRPAGAPGYAALQPIADAGSNPAVEMSINGVAYLAWSAGGDVQAARLERNATAFNGVPGPLDIDPAATAGTGTGRPKVDGRRRRRRHRGVGRGRPRLRAPDLRAAPVDRAAGPRRRAPTSPTSPARTTRASPGPSSARAARPSPAGSSARSSTPRSSIEGAEGADAPRVAINGRGVGYAGVGGAATLGRLRRRAQGRRVQPGRR